MKGSAAPVLIGGASQPANPPSAEENTQDQLSPATKIQNSPRKRPSMPSRQSCDRIEAYYRYYDYLQDRFVNGDSTEDRTDFHVKQCQRVIALVEANFSKTFSDSVGWWKIYQELDTDFEERFTSLCQRTNTQGGALLEPHSGSPKSGPEAEQSTQSSEPESAVSVFSQPQYGRVSICSENSSVHAENLANTRQRESYAQGFITNDTYQKDFRKDESWKFSFDDNNLFLSIWRVLNATPEYAWTIVAEFIYRTEEFTPCDFDCMEELDELDDSDLDYINQDGYEATGVNGSSLTGKATSGKKAQTWTPTTVPGSSKPSHDYMEQKRNRDNEDDEDDKKDKVNKKTRLEMLGKRWLCPYSLMYRDLISGACRAPTKFRSFSDLKRHLSLKHCWRSSGRGDTERPDHPELFMSDRQWRDIEEEAEMAARKKPKLNSEASFQKQLNLFLRVWGILFPYAQFEPESPFCEDTVCQHIQTLADAILDVRSRQAFELGKVSDPAEYRADRAEFNEGLQQVLAIMADCYPGTTDRIMNLLMPRRTGSTERCGMLPVTLLREESGQSRVVARVVGREPSQSYWPAASSAMFFCEAMEQPSPPCSTSDRALVLSETHVVNAEPDAGISTSQPDDDHQALSPVVDPVALHHTSFQGQGPDHETQASSSQIPEFPPSQNLPPGTRNHISEYPPSLLPGLDDEWDWNVGDSSSASTLWMNTLHPLKGEETEESWLQSFAFFDTQT